MSHTYTPGTAYRVDDLDGPLLDMAFAKAWNQPFKVFDISFASEPKPTGYGRVVIFYRDGDKLHHGQMGFCKPGEYAPDWIPRSDASLILHLIRSEGIMTGPPENPVHRNGGPKAGWGQSGVWGATSWKLRGPDGKRRAAHHGTDPAIAVLRFFIKCKLGDEVTL